jgi:hypothetical protein
VRALDEAAGQAWPEPPDTPPLPTLKKNNDIR